MNERTTTRRAGVCAGGYFAAAGVYLGSALVLASLRAAGLAAMMLLGTFPVICAVAGRLVLSEKPWTRKLAVALAAGFAVIHLDGLAYLYWAMPASAADHTRSPQWQLGVGLGFLWLTVLWSALRLDKRDAVTP
jgi:hypothetical protein